MRIKSEYDKIIKNDEYIVAGLGLQGYNNKTYSSSIYLLEGVFMFKIDNNVLERKMMYEGATVLTYKINYPSIKAKVHNFGVVNFNMYNKKQALDLQRRSENELFKQAVELYKYNKKNGYPQRAYEVVRN